MEKITKSDLLKAKYPKENNRFFIAMIIGFPISLLLLIISPALLGIIFIVWFTLSIAKVNLIGNSVKVSESNFPEIYNIYKEVKSELSYNKKVDIYIIEGGSVNAFIAKFFNTKFIILNSELVKDMLISDKLVQMKWIIARFIGALKAKHFRLSLFRIAFESVENIKIFNFFLLPYERATQYTGDNFGMLLTQNVEQSFNAFNKLLIGNDLSPKVNFEGILQQASELKNKNIFSFLARAFSYHPHLINRYLNLLAYAENEFPEQFNNYIKKQDFKTQRNIIRLLPKYK